MEMKIIRSTIFDLPSALAASMASFPRVVAIFYAIFDPHKGAEIIVQSPDEAITPPSSSSLFDFGSFSESIIPKKDLCNKLISFCTPSGYRIVGYPVHIPNQKYERNFLIYNLAFVFQEAGEIGSYIPVVERLALTFKQLEVRHLPTSLLIFAGTIKFPFYRHYKAASS